MTIRERLADWISGGALTAAQRQEDVWFRIAMNAQNQAEAKVRENSGGLEAALRGIIMHETPRANATVRRMARIAREALK